MTHGMRSGWRRMARAVSVFAVATFVGDVADAKTVSVRLSSPKHFKADVLVNSNSEKSIRAAGGNEVTWGWKLFSESKGAGIFEEDFNPDLVGKKQPDGIFTEDKFTIAPDLTISARTFKGINETAKTAWSQITATGAGQSFIIGDDKKKKFVAAASITLEGKLNLPKKPPTPVQASYTGKAAVADPFFIFEDDIVDAGIDPNDYSLFFAMGLTEFAGSDLSDVDLSFFLQTSAGTQTLFSADVDRTDTATGVNPAAASLAPAVEFYLLSDIDDEPDFATDTPIDHTAFVDGLIADLAADGSLDAPVFLGVLVRGVDLPDTALPNGAAAAVVYAASSGAFEADLGLVPLPPAVLLYGSGFALAAMFAAARRRLRSAA